MNLLIHDCTAAEWERIRDRYEGWTVVSDDGTIRPCIGCFRCWTGGTGECVFRDGYHRMCALIHEADEMVVMSRYTYGGFSSFVKNVFDRCIGYVLPEFEVAYGEMHHRKRFPGDKPVTFRFRGADLTELEKNKARRYVAAVCRNLRGSVKDVVFESCDPEDPVAASDAPKERSGILLVDTSLRGQRSNTLVLLKKLREDLKRPAELISLSSGLSADAAAEAIGRAETVVFGAPLYVDGLPAQAIRVMERVRETGAGRGADLYAVVNNGLYESRQNGNLLSMIRDFCDANGLRYRGAAAVGAGEVVGTLMRGKDRSLFPARNAERALSFLAEAIGSGSETEDLYADPYRFPRALYIAIANMNWQQLKRADRTIREKQ